MRSAAALLVAAIASPAAAQPAAAQPAAPRTIHVPYSQFTLPNGLRVILHEDHSVPMVTVNMWYHVGSAREKEKRTGFAHLFEHLMFMGSGHVKPGEFDEWLEAAGGDNNGSTETDRTNYWINVPSNSLELALFLESDRMGYLLDTMTPKTVDAQRDVVKNERRQSVENRPYGTAQVVLGEMLYPPGHPYHWPVIGYMEDLTAASYDDVVAFFKKFYAPSNASLVVAGDLRTADARARARARAESDRVVVLQPDGARRRVRRRRRSAERVLHLHRRSRLVQPGFVSVSRAVGERRERRSGAVSPARRARGADRGAGKASVGDDCRAALSGSPQRRA